MPHGPRKATLAFIFVTVVLDVLALGVIIPVLPHLIERFLQGNTVAAATTYGMFNTAWALMQFLFSPILGALSDRFGRRPVILISCFGLGLDYLLMAVAPTLGLLFLGRIISGITAASFPTAGAYIADVTPLEKRAAGFGMIGAAWGLGFILGPAIGGILGGIEPRLPFWVASALTLTNGIYGLFVLPESLSLDRREKFTWRRANPIGALTILRREPGLLGLAGVYTLYFLSHQVMPSVFVLYAAHRFGWDATTTGLTLAMLGVGSVVVQGLLVKPAVARFGERRMLLAGLLFGTAAYVVGGLAPVGWIYWLALPLFSLMGFCGPSMQGLMTRRVHATEQGKLQGVNSSLMGITGILGPTIFTGIFAYSIAPGSMLYLPGAPFFMAGILLVVGFFLAVRVARVGTPSTDPPIPLH